MDKEEREKKIKELNDQINILVKEGKQEENQEKIKTYYTVRQKFIDKYINRLKNSDNTYWLAGVPEENINEFGLLYINHFSDKEKIINELESVIKWHDDKIEKNDFVPTDISCDMIIHMPHYSGINIYLTNNYGNDKKFHMRFDTGDAIYLPSFSEYRQITKEEFESYFKKAMEFANSQITVIQN